MNTFRSSATERFAYTVPSLEEVDTDIAAMVRAALADEAILTIIVAPRQQHIDARSHWWRRWFGMIPWRWTPAWVLVMTARRLLVVERTQPGATPTICTIRPESLLAVEVGVVLLQGWLTCIQARDNQVETVEVRFNTVCDELFWDVQRRLCRAAAPPTAVTQERRLDLLEPLPYRFKHLLPRRLLLPHEVIEAVLYQDAIWQRRFWVFKRRVAPSRVVVLTSDHILIASDEDAAAGGASHGMIARYFPRRHVRAVRATPHELGWTLTITAADATATGVTATGVTAETDYALLLAHDRLAAINDFLQACQVLDNVASA